jgi:hypothetical protein
VSTRATLTVVLVIVAVAFGGWRLLAPKAERASDAAGESATALTDTVSRASFVAAQATLQAQLSATGSYAGAALQPPMTLVRADASGYCIQLDRAPAVQHLNGPGGSPEPGPCS